MIKLFSKISMFIYNDITFKPQGTFSPIEKSDIWGKKEKKSQLNVISNKLFYLLKEQKIVEKMG